MSDMKDAIFEKEMLMKSDEELLDAFALEIRKETAMSIPPGLSATYKKYILMRMGGSGAEKITN